MNDQNEDDKIKRKSSRRRKSRSQLDSIENVLNNVKPQENRKNKHLNEDIENNDADKFSIKSSISRTSVFPSKKLSAKKQVWSQTY